MKDGLAAFATMNFEVAARQTVPSTPSCDPPTSS